MIPTNEELLIARDTLRVIAERFPPVQAASLRDQPDRSDSAFHIHVYFHSWFVIGIVYYAPPSLRKPHAKISPIPPETKASMPIFANNLTGRLADAAAHLHVVIVLRIAAQVHLQLAHAHIELHAAQIEAAQIEMRLAGSRNLRADR